jgi:hypothetical protein
VRGRFCSNARRIGSKDRCVLRGGLRTFLVPREYHGATQRPDMRDSTPPVAPPSSHTPGMCRHTHTQTDTYTCAHAHIHINTLSCTHNHMHPCTHTCKHTFVHKRPCQHQQVQHKPAPPALAACRRSGL